MAARSLHGPNSLLPPDTVLYLQEEGVALLFIRLVLLRERPCSPLYLGLPWQQPTLAFLLSTDAW